MPDTNKNQKFEAAIEAILFVYGEPMEIAKLARTLKAEKSDVEGALDKIASDYETGPRGVRLILQSGKVQLVTKPEFSPLLHGFIKEEFKETLSPASLESLALILYLGPLTRAEIDYYRGVNSSFILRSLLMRGLIDRLPHPEKGNVYVYQSSFDLLKYLGIAKPEELPEYEKYSHQRITNPSE